MYATSARAGTYLGSGTSVCEWWVRLVTARASHTTHNASHSPLHSSSVPQISSGGVFQAQTVLARSRAETRHARGAQLQ